jgi:hypothetical protein
LDENKLEEYIMKKLITIGVVAVALVLSLSLQANAVSNGYDGDYDNDGVLDSEDNCRIIPNPKEEVPQPDDLVGPPEFKQLDSDDDGVGDACDNCIDDPNPDQEDTFGVEEFGDACEDETADPIVDDNDDDDTDGGDVDESFGDDADLDGISDAEDNCMDAFNADQADEDEDGVGDACDLGYDINIPSDVGFDEGSGCSVVPAATANPLMLLLISAAFIPVAIRRRK